MYPYPMDPEKNDENGGEPLMNASSEQDCTGLSPAAPGTEEEFESYGEVYDFLPKAVAPEPRERS